MVKTIDQKIEFELQKIKNFFYKIIGGLGVIILLETGALIYTVAIGGADNKYQDEAILRLTQTIEKNSAETQKNLNALTEIAIKNVEKIDANKDRLDRSPH